MTTRPRVPAREVGNLIALGSIADDAFLAARHAALRGLRDEDRAALEEVREIFRSLVAYERPTGPSASRIRRMASMEAAASLLEDEHELEVEEDRAQPPSDEFFVGIVKQLDRALDGDGSREDFDEIAKIFERIAVSSVGAADEMLRPSTPRTRWSTTISAS